MRDLMTQPFILALASVALLALALVIRAFAPIPAETAGGVDLIIGGVLVLAKDGYGYFFSTTRSSEAKNATAASQAATIASLTGAASTTVTTTDAAPSPQGGLAASLEIGFRGPTPRLAASIALACLVAIGLSACHPKTSDQPATPVAARGDTVKALQVSIYEACATYDFGLRRAADALKANRLPDRAIPIIKGTNTVSDRVCTRQAIEGVNDAAILTANLRSVRDAAAAIGAMVGQ
jgi:hypothetical protein